MGPFQHMGRVICSWAHQHAAVGLQLLVGLGLCVDTALWLIAFCFSMRLLQAHSVSRRLLQSHSVIVGASILMSVVLDIVPEHQLCACICRYAFNIIFNILNKSSLNAFPCPWFISAMQLSKCALGLAATVT